MRPMTAMPVCLPAGLSTDLLPPYLPACQGWGHSDRGHRAPRPLHAAQVQAHPTGIRVSEDDCSADQKLLPVPPCLLRRLQVLVCDDRLQLVRGPHPCHAPSLCLLPHRLCPPSLSLCRSYVTVSIAENAPQRRDGRLSAPERPGLGVEARREVLGRPVYVIEA